MNVANSYSSSVIKQTALTLLNVIDDLAQPHIRNTVIKKFWDWFFVSHGKAIIQKETDEELKKVMQKGYLALKPIYERANLNNEIKEARKYNSGPGQDFVESITPADVMELF